MIEDRFSFEPTYKEWKPDKLKDAFKSLMAFWAYLQGMETSPLGWLFRLGYWFWAYLQGMETPHLIEVAYL